MDNEIMKRKTYSIENSRRRHNFVPFIITLMKELAKRNQLTSMYENGVQKEKQRRENILKQKMNLLSNTNTSTSNTN